VPEESYIRCRWVPEESYIRCRWVPEESYILRRETERAGGRRYRWLLKERRETDREKIRRRRWVVDIFKCNIERLYIERVVNQDPNIRNEGGGGGGGHEWSPED